MHDSLDHWITRTRTPSESARPDTESAPKNPNTHSNVGSFCSRRAKWHRLHPTTERYLLRKSAFCLASRSSSHPTTLRCGLRVPLRFRASQSDAYQAVACFRTRWPAQPGLEANINGAGHGPLPRGFAPMTNMHIDTQAKSKQLTAQRETLIIPAM